MDKNSLRKLVSDKLGISSSKKEFAFDVFLKRISQALEANEAFKLPGIGYFQLKNEPLLKEERKVSNGKKKLTKRTIFYSPAGSADKNESSLFLSFDIDVPRKDITEFDENIFSLGIQKPIVPIFEDDESLSALQKSIESRIDDLIFSSEKLSDFDLFDNYVNQELEIDENIDTDAGYINNIPEDTFNDLSEINTETIEPLQKNNSDGETRSVEVETYEFNTDLKEEENDSQEKEFSSFDELEKIKFEEETNLETVINEDESPDNEIIESADINIKVTDKSNQQDIQTNKKEIKKSATPSLEELLDNDDDILDSVLPASEKEIEQQFALEEENEESIEWDWGDELKAEFHEEIDENDALNKNEIDDNSELKPPLCEDFDNIAEDLKDEISIEDDNLIKEDKYENKIDSDREFDKDNDDYLNEETDFQSDRQELENIEDEEIPKEPKKQKSRPAYRNYDWKGTSYGKGFWILLVSFFIVTISGLYYLLFWGGAQRNVEEIKNEMPADSVFIEKPTVEIENPQIDSSKIITTEPIEVAAVETEPEEEKTLYRKFENETRINSQIYSDGKRFMVQVSSFKSTGRAESDAAKYQALGFDAFIVEANLPQLGGKWYRVRIGYFKSQNEALDFIKNNL